MNEIEMMFNRVGLLGIAEQNLETYQIIGIKPMNFTAEKQIELIKWLASSRKGVLISDMDKCDFNISTGYYYCAKHIQKFRNNKDLSVAIAMFINDIWKDLTEDQCKQIKDILE